MAQPNMYNQDQKWLTGLAGKRWFYRLWEIIPGVTSWIVLISPIFFSLVWPIAVAYFIIAFDLLWLLKSVRMSAGLIEGYMALKKKLAFFYKPDSNAYKRSCGLWNS